MQRVFSLRIILISAAILALIGLPACGGGGNTANTTVTSILLTPNMVSLNQGGVAQLSAIALNSAGSQVPADLTFTSSNTAIATISSGGLICGGIWDSSIINCNATLGQAGVGKITITATATAKASGVVNDTSEFSACFPYTDDTIFANGFDPGIF